MKAAFKLLFAFICISQATIPWPQHLHDSQHSSYIELNLKAKYACPYSFSYSSTLKQRSIVNGMAIGNDTYITTDCDSACPSDDIGVRTLDSCSVERLRKKLKPLSKPLLSTDGDILFIVDNAVTAYDSSRFSELWKVEVSTKYSLQNYILSKNNTLYSTVNTNVTAVANGIVLWNTFVNTSGQFEDAVLSPQEETLYVAALSSLNPVLELIAIEASTGQLKWNITVPGYLHSDLLKVRGDGVVIINAFPPNATNFTYYQVSPDSQLSPGIVGATALAIVGNTFIIGNILDQSTNGTKFSNFAQLDQFGNTLRTFEFFSAFEVSNLKVVATLDTLLVVAESSSLNTSSLFAYFNYSSTVTALSDSFPYDIIEVALNSQGDIVVAHKTGISIFSSCSGKGTCYEGKCYYPEKNPCKKKLSTPELVIIVLLSSSVLIAGATAVIAYRRRHSHRGYYTPIK